MIGDVGFGGPSAGEVLMRRGSSGALSSSAGEEEDTALQTLRLRSTSGTVPSGKTSTRTVFIRSRRSGGSERERASGGESERASGESDSGQRAAFLPFGESRGFKLTSLVWSPAHINRKVQ